MAKSIQEKAGGLKQESEPKAGGEKQQAIRETLHDLRNLINVVFIYTHLIMNQTSDSALQSKAEKIEKVGTQMRELIQQLSDLNSE